MNTLIPRITAVAVTILVIAYINMALDMREVAKTLDAQNSAINSLVSILEKQQIR